MYLSRFCFSLLFLLGVFIPLAQNSTELNNAPKFLSPSQEQEGPSLIKPNKEKSLLSEDFFNPKIEFENPKKKKENPNYLYGEKEKFIDPGKRYLNKINRKPEGKKNPNNFKTDQYLGDFRNNGKFVQIALRDHESPDGDLIKIMLNDREIIPRVLLQERFKTIAIDLIMGFNKIDFVALNQGSSGPNTAEIRVFDDKGNLVGSNRWNLATGVKATYIVVKEE